MKKHLIILLSFILAFSNIFIVSAANIDDHYKEAVQQELSLDTYEYVEPYGLVEFITGYVGGKLVNFLLSEISGTEYTKIVTKNGIRYCVVYSGNHWTISSGSYRIFTR